MVAELTLASCGVENLNSVQRRMVSRRVQVVKRSRIVSPLLSLKRGRARKQNQFIFEAVVRRCARRHRTRKGAEVRLTSGSSQDASHPSCDST